MVNLKILVLLFLLLMLFVTSIISVFQTYEFRKYYSLSEELRNKSNDLSFRYDLLLDEVENLKNQINLRRVAADLLKMRPPTSSEKVIIFLD